MMGVSSLLRKAWKMAVAPLAFAAAMAGAAHAQDMSEKNSFDPSRAYAQRVANEVSQPVTYIDGEVILPAADLPVTTAAAASAQPIQKVTATPVAYTVRTEEPLGMPLDLTPPRRNYQAADADIIDNAAVSVTQVSFTQAVPSEPPVNEELVTITAAPHSPHNTLLGYEADNTEYQAVRGLYERMRDLSPALSEADPVKLFVFAHVLLQEDRGITRQLSAGYIRTHRGLPIDGSNILGVAQSRNPTLYNRLSHTLREGNVAGALETAFHAFDNTYLRAVDADALIDSGRFAELVLLGNLSYNMGPYGVRELLGNRTSFADMNAAQIRANAYNRYGRISFTRATGVRMTEAEAQPLRASLRGRLQRTATFGGTFQLALDSAPAIASVTYADAADADNNVQAPTINAFQTAGGAQVQFVSDQVPQPAPDEEDEIVVTAHRSTLIGDVTGCATGASRRASAVTLDSLSGDALCATRGDEVRVAASITKLWSMAALYDAALERAEGRTAVPQTLSAAAYMPDDPQLQISQAAWGNLLGARQASFDDFFNANFVTEGGYRLYGRGARLRAGQEYTLGHLTDLATVYSANDAMQEVNLAVENITGASLIERMPGVLLEATQRGDGFFCNNLGQAQAGDVTGERWDTTMSACQLAYLTRWTHNNFTAQFEHDFSIRDVSHRGRNYEHSGVRFGRLTDQMVARQQEAGEAIVDYDVQVKTGWNRRARYTGVLDFSQTVRHNDLNIECDRGVITVHMGGTSMNDRSNTMMRNVGDALRDMREDERETYIEGGIVRGPAANRCYVIGERGDYLATRNRGGTVLPAVQESMPDRPRILQPDYTLAAFAPLNDGGVPAGTSGVFTAAPPVPN